MKNITSIILLFVFILTGCSFLKKNQLENNILKKTDEYYHLEGSKIYGKHNKYISDGGILEPKYVEDVNIETFQVLGGGYAKDKNSAYLYDGYIRYIKDADIETFTYVGNYFAKDKKQVYFKNKIIKNADPKTFNLFKDKETNTPETNLAISFFSRDKKNLYLYDKKINVEQNTFEVLSWKKAKDINNTYILDMNKGELFIEK